MPDTPEEMEDLDRPATRRDLVALEAAMKADLGALQAAMKADQVALETRLRRHFDVVVEAFKTEFGSLYDWTHATVSSLDKRVGHLETDHGGRLLGVETRVTRLEKRRK